jgi:hypothetical protein
MKYTVEMDLGDMTYIPTFMTVGSAIQVIFGLISKKFQWLQC